MENYAKNAVTKEKFGKGVAKSRVYYGKGAGQTSLFCPLIYI
jgi:hypothetical protein